MFFRSIRWRLQIWHATILVVVLTIFGGTVYYLQMQMRMQQIDAELHRTAEMVGTGVRRAFRPPPWMRFSGGGPRPQGAERRGRDRRERDEASLPRESSADDEAPATPPSAPEVEPQETADTSPRNAPRTPRERRSTELRLPEEIAHLFEGEEGETPRYYFIVWRDNGEILHKSPSAPYLELPTFDSEDSSSLVRIERQRGEFREVIHDSRFAPNILVGRSIRPDLLAQYRFGWLIVGLGLTVLSAGLLGGMLLSRRMIAPIAEMSSTAAEISVSNLSRRLNVDEADSELGSLASTLNEMFDRLEQAFEQQVRFTADASHELRTPLAVILSHTELALARERSAADYRKTIETCRRAALRVKSLVEQLLTLARLDTKELSLEYREFDVAACLYECVELVRPLAEQRGIRIECELPSLLLTGDSVRLGQVFTNLLTNAIAYNRDRGRIEVSLAGVESEAIITVADTGIGIPPEHLPHVFERFYRGDASRSEGGSGLGLAICKSIVEAHCGTITAMSDHRGSSFQIRLPREGVGRGEDETSSP